MLICENYLFLLKENVEVSSPVLVEKEPKYLWLQIGLQSSSVGLCTQIFRELSWESLI